MCDVCVTKYVTKEQFCTPVSARWADMSAYVVPFFEFDKIPISFIFCLSYSLFSYVKGDMDNKNEE